MHWHVPASEPKGNTLRGFQDYRAENGSSQGENLALTLPPEAVFLFF
jgi:hypothetical protein